MIAVFAVFGIIIGIVGIKEESKLQDEMKDVISANSDFSATEVIKDEVYNNYFAVDENNQEFFCYSNGVYVRFNYKDIVSVDLQIEGDTITNKSTSLGGAIVGGLIAGGVGAVVGGTSLGDSRSKKMVSSIIVHMLIRFDKVDSFDIQCLGNNQEVETNSLQYKYAYNNAKKMYETLMFAIDKVKNEEQKDVQKKSNLEEIKELADLKKQGLITDDEFVTMKTKLLQNN